MNGRGPYRRHVRPTMQELANELTIYRIQNPCHRIDTGLKKESMTSS